MRCGLVSRAVCSQRVFDLWRRWVWYVGDVWWVLALHLARRLPVLRPVGHHTVRGRRRCPGLVYHVV